MDWLYPEGQSLLLSRPQPETASDVALLSRYGPMILFAAATGLRPAEWIALERRDVDRDGRVVYVRRAFTKGELKRPKTDASIRAVPLQARAVDALERVHVNGDSPLLFPGERGGYLDIHHFRSSGGQPSSRSASTRFGGSTISGTPLRPSRFVPASPPLTSPAQIDFTVEVFCVYAGRVLLRRHDKFGIWLGVGGHVELDEDPCEAAHREVREEVGLEIELLGESPVPADPRSGEYRQLVPPAFLHRHRVSANHVHVVLTYFARALSDTVVAGGIDRSDEWRWASREDLDHPDLDLHANVRFYAEQALAAAGDP